MLDKYNWVRFLKGPFTVLFHFMHLKKQAKGEFYVQMRLNSLRKYFWKIGLFHKRNQDSLDKWLTPGLRQGSGRWFLAISLCKNARKYSETHGTCQKGTELSWKDFHRTKKVRQSISGEIFSNVENKLQIKPKERRRKKGTQGTG